MNYCWVKPKNKMSKLWGIFVIHYFLYLTHPLKLQLIEDDRSKTLIQCRLIESSLKIMKASNFYEAIQAEPTKPIDFLRCRHIPQKLLFFKIYSVNNHWVFVGGWTRWPRYYFSNQTAPDQFFIDLVRLIFGSPPRSDWSSN